MILNFSILLFNFLVAKFFAAIQFILKLKLKWIVVISYIFFASCQSSSSESINTKIETEPAFSLIILPKPQNLANSEVKKLHTACENWFDSTFLTKGFNGGMIVAKDGNIVFEKYSGTAHIPGDDIINERTSMQIASVSKTFTAMAVLKLWQDGKLNIDDNVNKYITGFNYPGVTIRTLLNHRSGLPNYLYFMETAGVDKNKMLTNQDVVNYLINNKMALPNIAPPNMHFSYCNTNYALLALLVEKVSGKKFPNYLKYNFFDPLQMKNTFIADSTNLSKATPSYDWKGRQVPLNFLDGVYGDKNVFTTPQDLLIWDRALRSDKIFKPETLDQAYAPYSNEHPGVKNYGLGWRMNIYPNGKKIIFHNGWWHGSNACFVRLLKENATIILIGNKFNRSIYGAKILCNLFGDFYTTEKDDEENESNKLTDSLSSFKKNNGFINSSQKLSHQNYKLNNMFKDMNKVNTH